MFRIWTDFLPVQSYVSHDLLALNLCTILFFILVCLVGCSQQVISACLISGQESKYAAYRCWFTLHNGETSGGYSARVHLVYCPFRSPLIGWSCISEEETGLGACLLLALTPAKPISTSAAAEMDSALGRHFQNSPPPQLCYASRYKVPWFFSS